MAHYGGNDYQAIMRQSNFLGTESDVLIIQGVPKFIVQRSRLIAMEMFQKSSSFKESLCLVRGYLSLSGVSATCPTEVYCLSGTLTPKRLCLVQAPVKLEPPILGSESNQARLRT